MATYHVRAFVDDDGIIESKAFYSPLQFPDLLGRMLSRVLWVRLEVLNTPISHCKTVCFAGRANRRELLRYGSIATARGHLVLRTGRWSTLVSGNFAEKLHNQCF